VFNSSTHPLLQAPWQYLEIYLDTFINEIEQDNTWFFLGATDDKGSNQPCTSKSILQPEPKAPDNLFPGQQAWPNGTFKLKTHRLDYTYSSDGKEPGTLDYPEKQTTWVKKLQEVDCPNLSDFGDDYMWEAVCSWW
jgi:hypothetical protein